MMSEVDKFRLMMIAFEVSVFFNLLSLWVIFGRRK